MLSRIVLLFLIGIAVLAFLGRLRFPRAIRSRRKAQAMPAKCPRCGRYIIGQGGCDCGQTPKGRG
jgi:hypothetical protein